MPPMRDGAQIALCVYRTTQNGVPHEELLPSSSVYREEHNHQSRAGGNDVALGQHQIPAVSCGVANRIRLPDTCMHGINYIVSGS